MTERHLNLKVTCGKDYEEVRFTIKASTPLIKLFQKYCDRNNLNIRSVNFIYNGIKINDEDTPLALGMENDDEINCIVL